jgi:HlyD family secretion protein
MTAAASRGDLVITVSDRGELESAQSVQVLCDVEGGGRLVTITPEGAKVKKGDEVARFDTDALVKSIADQGVKCEQAEGRAKAARSELEVQLNREQSEIAQAQLALTLAKIDYESYEEGEYLVELEKRRAALEIGKKELKEAEDNLAFTRSLIKKGLAQLEQERVMELNVDGKQFAVNQQEADLRVLEKFTKTRKLVELKAKAEDAEREMERVKKSQAAASEKAATDVKSAERTAMLEKGQLERLTSQLDKCVVKAPEAGILIYANLRPWDDSSRIRQGGQVFYQQPIFKLPDLNNMQVKLKVHESVVKRVIQNQVASMQVDALPNQTLHGKVVSVASVAQSDSWRGNSVKEYETVVSIDDLPRDAGLRPGMTAEVKVLIKTLENVLSVPVQAVTEWGDQHVCYVVSSLGIDRRAVKVGDSNEQRIQILAGLEAGEKVALDARLRAASELKKEQGREQPKKENSDDNKNDREPVKVAVS